MAHSVIEKAQSATPTQAPTLSESAKEHSPRKMTEEVILKLATTQPATALAYIKDHLIPQHQSALFSKVLAIWAKSAPQEAWNWVCQKMPDDYTQYDAVLSEIGKANPDTALRFATELAGKKDAKHTQTIFVSALRGIVYSGNYRLATQLIANAQLPPGREEFDLSSFVAGEWGRYNPEEAAQWVKTLPQDSSSRQWALTSLGVSWAQSDPRAVADFAAQLSPSVGRQNMLSTALSTWAVQQPEEAGAWLNQHPNDPSMDSVVRSMAGSPKLVQDHPDLAVAWANTIFDDDIRLQTMGLIVTQWMESNPLAANEFLKTTKDLTPEMVEQIRKNLAIRTPR